MGAAPGFIIGFGFMGIAGWLLAAMVTLLPWPGRSYSVSTPRVS